MERRNSVVYDLLKRVKRKVLDSHHKERRVNDKGNNSRVFHGNGRGSNQVPNFRGLHSCDTITYVVPDPVNGGNRTIKRHVSEILISRGREWLKKMKIFTVLRGIYTSLKSIKSGAWICIAALLGLISWLVGGLAKNQKER